MKIVIELSSGKVLELTKEEAEELFGGSKGVEVPAQPTPWCPQNPWPYNPGTPYGPYEPYEITCQLKNTSN